MGVVALERVRQAGCTSVGRIDIASFENTTGQDAQPQLHLVEPGALCGRTMADMLRGRSTQERSPLPTAAQVLGHHGHLAPPSAQPAALQAPGGLELLPHPVVTRHRGQWVDDGGPLGGHIAPGTRLAQMPHDVTGGHAARGHHRPHPLPDVVMLALLRLARCPGRCGVLAWQHRPAGLCIGAQDHTLRCKEAVGVEGEATNSRRFGLTIWGVAVEPLDTALGCEVRLSQHTPETRPTHGPEAPWLAGSAQVVKAPARGLAVVCRGCPGGHRQHSQTRCGGKSAAADPSAAHLAGHGGPAPESDCANAPRSGGYTATRWPRADSTGGLAPPPVR